MTKDSNKIDFYDDENHDYQDFWVGRDYEHESELIAINKLLKNRHYNLAMDYGGGYGRITPTLLKFSDKVVLVDPSKKQLSIAKRKLDQSKVDFVQQEQKDSVPAKDNSLDLLVMIRVSHHLPDPNPVLGEIARSLRPGAEALIEIASEAHFVNRLRYLKRLKSVPLEPVPVGVHSNGLEEDTPFVNHNPKTIEDQLSSKGLEVVRKLSVSNLRHRAFKQHIPMSAMLALERAGQRPLAKLNFGPSIFYLVKKK
ncbi:MAG: class I SAM-dependent methyltransferase [Candidatus Saccharimonadales bacterium]